MARLTFHLDDRQHEAWLAQLSALTTAYERVAKALETLIEPAPDFTAVTAELKASADNLNQAVKKGELL